MSHYRFLDPAIKRRARERGLDIERSTDEFLRLIRTGHGGRRDIWDRLSALMTGPRVRRRR